VTPDVRVLAEFGRERVLGLRTSTRRRIFPAELSVHRLPPWTSDPARAGGGVDSRAVIATTVAAWTAPLAGTSGWDWHLRRELVGRLLEQADDSSSDPEAPVLMVWTRPGPAEPEDSDAAWWAAARSACADLAVQLHGMAVVTRWGWWMLPEGPERRWQRLRANQGRRRPKKPVATALPADAQPSGQV